MQHFLCIKTIFYCQCLKGAEVFPESLVASKGAFLGEKTARNLKRVDPQLNFSHHRGERLE